jgi:hypothetical protein
MVTTTSLWLNNGVGFGGLYARMRVIFILGSAAKAGTPPAADAIAAAERAFRNLRRCIGKPPILASILALRGRFEILPIALEL